MLPKAPLFVTISCLLAPTYVAAQDASATSVVIIPTKAKGGPNLKKQVKKRIEKKLKKDVQVVPFKTFKKAAKRAGIKGKAVMERESAVPAGTEAGVTHVCYIEGQREKDGRKKYYFAEITVVEVSSGDVVFTNRYALKGRKINAVIAGSMLEELTAALSAPPPPPPEPLEEEPVVEEPPPPPDLPPPAEEPVEEPVVVATGLPEEPVTDEPTTIASLNPGFGESSGITVSQPVSSRKRKRWRPSLHIGAGGLAIQRNADIESSGALPPGYKGPLPGGYLRLDFYPMAIGGRGDWYEGFGIHAEGQYMRVETIYDETTEASVTSDVIAANGGLSFRLVFWDSATAPDFTLKGGYGLFIFPLAQGVFPGTRYAGPYAGGLFTVPFIEQVALLAGGSLTFQVTTSGKLKRLGTSVGGLFRPRPSFGFRAEGGVRLFFDPFELIALYRYERWSTSYRGTTDLEGSLSQFNNVNLVDQMHCGLVTAGVAF